MSAAGEWLPCKAARPRRERIARSAHDRGGRTPAASPAGGQTRARLEATVRSVKHVFLGGKLPVRGLARATMMICASAMMANLRRIHGYRRENALGGFFASIIRSLRRLYTRSAQLWQPFGACRSGRRAELRYEVIDCASSAGFGQPGIFSRPNPHSKLTLHVAHNLFELRFAAKTVEIESSRCVLDKYL